MQYINTVLYKYLHFYKFNLLVLQVRITLLGGVSWRDVGYKRSRGSGNLSCLDVGAGSMGYSLCKTSLNRTLLICAFFHMYGSLQ